MAADLVRDLRLILAHAARAVGRPFDKTTDLMEPLLVEVAGGLRDASVITDGEVGAIGIRLPLTIDAELASRVGKLQHQVTGSKALTGLAMARSGAIQIEIAIGSGGNYADGWRGLFGSLTVEGPATLAEDLDVLAALGCEPEPREVLATLARVLGADRDGNGPRQVRAIGFTAPFRHNTRLELGVAPDPDILAMLGFRLDQLPMEPAVLDVAHQLEGPPYWLRLGTEPGVIAPSATLVFGPQSHESARRLVDGLAAAEGASARLDSFARALGATRLRTVELTLCPEPIAWLGAALDP